MATNEQPWEILTYSCHTCGVTAPWGGRLLRPHLNHSSIRIACNGCHQSFTDKTSALHHFKQHLYTRRGYQTPLRRLSADDIPPAPHNTPERSVTSQASSSPKQNVLRPTLSPVISQHHSRLLLHCSQLNSRAHVRHRQFHHRAPQPPLLPVTWSICETN